MDKRIRNKFILTCFIVLLSFGCMFNKTLAVQRFCGKTLTETMKLLCINGYNPKPLKRKGNDFYNDVLANDIITLNMSNSSNSLIYPATNYLSSPTSPFLMKLYKGIMLTQTRRRRSPGGIYYECCVNGCSTTEMISYCL